MNLTHRSLFRAIPVTLLVLSLSTSAVVVGSEPAHAATAGSGVCAQQVDNATDVVVSRVVDDCVVQFKRVGTTNWSVPVGVNQVSAVIVGGGGGGGSWTGAGGGAGGVVAHGDVFGTLDATSALSISAGTDISVVVGAGGSGSVTTGANPNPTFTAGSNGQSSFLGTVVAYGGGVGGSQPDNTVTTQNPNGGSSTVGSGGGGSNGTPFAGGAGNSTSFVALGGRGFAGGSGHSVLAQPHASGGGGGAGESGESAPDKDNSGDGGDGVEFIITGSSLWLAGGGGGGIHGTSTAFTDGTVGAGGQGGGGDGSGPNRTDWTGNNPGQNPIGEAGAANTGGGGGGAGADGRTAGWTSTGGAGGSGIVIVRYALSPNPPTGVSATAGVDEITVTYTAPSYTGGPASSLLHYSTDAGVTWSALGEVDGSTTLTTESGGDPLERGQSYTVQLRAQNDASFVSSVASASPVTVLATQPPSANETDSRSQREETTASSAAIHLDLQVSVGQPIAGATVVIGGQGVAARSAYSLIVRSTPQTIASGRASSAGNFSESASMPALSPGSHTLTLTALAPDGSTVSLVQVLSVAADGTVTTLGSPTGTWVSVLAATGTEWLSMLWGVGLAMLIMGAGVSAIAMSRIR